MLGKIADFLKKSVAPVSSDEDKARREFIANTLLLASIFLVLAAFVTNAVYQSENVRIFLAAKLILVPLSFLVALYIFSRKGYAYFSSLFLLLTLFLFASAMGYRWGVDLDSEILIYVLVVVMSGILISARASFIAMCCVNTFLAVVGFLHNAGIVPVDRSWTSTELWDFGEIFIASIIFFTIATVSWLSNREIEKSLKRARRSEAELKKERDFLEITVEKRTRELREAQLAEMAQLYRFAEFGRLSSGLFHDLINPLNAVSLNMEKIKSRDGYEDEVAEARTYLDKSISAVRKMQGFVAAVRKQMSHQEEDKALFSLNEEIGQVVEILEHKAILADVKIDFLFSGDIMIFGNAIKFNQVVLNVVGNAIDSYADLGGGSGAGRGARTVSVFLSEKDGAISLVIKDGGAGISKENISRIFEPFFSTKSSSNGMGIGLPLVKRIVEKDFNGTISVDSEEGAGTEVTIKFDK